MTIYAGKSLNRSYSKLGESYELPQGLEKGSDEAKSYLAGSQIFRVKQLEVFTVTLKQ